MRPDQSILLVEDDRVDVMTVKRAFKELGINNPVHHSENGEAALAFLRQHKDQPPCLILLDLNMPIMNGIEFLKEAKQDDALKIIPVVVLTTSKGDIDKLESFKNGVAGYMIKSIDYNKFLDVVAAVKSYWSTSELPFG